MDQIAQEKLVTIFAPKVAEKRSRLREQRLKVAHYTSAQNAMQILQGEQVWLRNVKYMNDFQEFTHGFDMMLNFFGPDAESQTEHSRRGLFSALDAIYPGLFGRVIDKFNSWVPTIREGTFVACLTEHLPEENEIGRLSMWRGYGNNAPPVALVINPDVFYTTTDALGAYSSPVSYQTPEQFHQCLSETAEMVVDNKDFLLQAGAGAVDLYLFQALLHYAVCQKHRGFNEEREWRILHIPRLHPKGKMTQSRETIRDRPQIVYKLPLKSYPDEGIIKASVPELLDRVIIGPMLEPLQIREVFISLLEEMGIADAERKVIVSEIPFRTGL